jgi:hypothetical protein
MSLVYRTIARKSMANGAAYFCGGLAWLIADNFNRKVEEVEEVLRLW